jgi:hypothetical protein
MSDEKGKKSKPSNLCMFCGKDETFGPMNMEHFVPRGLWAGPRPSGTKTCPAHVECNKRFAEDSDYFRLVNCLGNGTGFFFTRSSLPTPPPGKGCWGV